jgi:hypothetical protein
MVLSLGYQESQTSCQSWISSHGLTYPVLSDMSGSTSQLFIPVQGGYLYFPHNCVVDQDQIMRYTATGWNQSAVQSMIQSLLQPEAAFSPTELNYGAVTYGANIPMTLIIDNAGTGILNITSITTSNPTLFSVNPTSGQIYAVRDSLVITVTLHATQSCVIDEVLNVVSNIGTSTVNLWAIVSGADACMWVNPTSVDFDSIEVGQSSEQTLWAYNYGPQPVTISSISTNSPFSVTPQSGTIPVGDSLEVTVSATPSGPGTFNDEVSFVSNGGNRDIDVSVLGVQALIGSTITSVDFGNVNVGSFQTRFFRVRNEGTGVLNITNVNLETNIESMSYNLQNTSINPGDSSVCVLVWTPHSGGSLDGSITFSSNGGTLVIDLIGTATGSGVDDEEFVMPTKFSLEQNYPNPFNSSTMIPYALPHAAPVQITIYNTYGRLVRTIDMGEQPAGWHRAFWAGDDNHGNPITSGIYFYRLLVDGRSLDLRKMVYMK